MSQIKNSYQQWHLLNNYNFFIFTKNNIEVKFNAVSTHSVSMMIGPLLSAVYTVPL